MALKSLLRVGIASLAVMVCSAAFATDMEVLTYSPLASDGTQATVAPGTEATVASTGGYNLGKIRIDGTFSKVNAGDYASEARLEITGPDGSKSYVGPFTTTTSYTDPQTVTLSTYITAYYGLDPVGNWKVRAYESFDDGGVGSVDKNWDSLTVTFTDEPDTSSPPSAIDLGTLGAGDTIDTQSFVGGDVKWYKFTLAAPTAGSEFLDIDTEGTTTFGTGNDTEIGLYRSNGLLITDDDDSGSSLLSQLSFGPDAGDRGDGGFTGALNYDGRDGNLPAGTYYLAVVGYNATFGQFWAVTTTSTSAGDVQVNLRRPGGGGGGGSDVSGQVTLNNLDPIGGPAGEVCHWQIRDGVTDAVLDEGDVSLNLGGSYFFHTTVSSGSHTITMQGATWLRVATFGVTMGGPVGGQNFVLENGDCDGSDIVDLGDFDVLAAGFGYSDGDAGYIPSSDLDQNGVTDLGDFDIMSFQFGNSGYGD